MDKWMGDNSILCISFSTEVWIPRNMNTLRVLMCIDVLLNPMDFFFNIVQGPYSVPQYNISCHCIEATGVKHTVYPMKYAHGFVVLCFVVVMQSFIMNSHEVFIHIHQGCFAGTGAIVRLPQCQWSKPDGYGKISQCITTTKHSKAKTMCIFLGIYCNSMVSTHKRYPAPRPRGRIMRPVL